jgi:hypothetical protein
MATYELSESQYRELLGLLQKERPNCIPIADLGEYRDRNGEYGVVDLKLGRNGPVIGTLKIYDTWTNVFDARPPGYVLVTQDPGVMKILERNEIQAVRYTDPKEKVAEILRATNGPDMLKRMSRKERERLADALTPQQPQTEKHEEREKPVIERPGSFEQWLREYVTSNKRQILEMDAKRFYQAVKTLNRILGEGEKAGVFKKPEPKEEATEPAPKQAAKGFEHEFRQYVSAERILILAEDKKPFLRAARDLGNILKRGEEVAAWKEQQRMRREAVAAVKEQKKPRILVASSK